MSAAKTGRFVIIGASLAGGSAASALREDGFEGDITMIGAETSAALQSAPALQGLSARRGPLRGSAGQSAAFYTERHINLRLGVRATAIDPGGKNVTLEGGEMVPYDRLLVTTGGRNRTLSTPGGDLPGIFQLRTVEDCDRIRAEARPGAARWCGAWASSARR
jgi:3-phenylpropionate/trans-cinnamate dioxygenase ferredoxin reductase subunit